MTPKRQKTDPTKRRTRHEPPTLQEAIVAAQGIADDTDGQVAIAAQLMGLPETEVRAAVLQSKPALRGGIVRDSLVRTNVRSQRTVVVERRSRPLSLAQRTPAE